MPYLVLTYAHALLRAVWKRKIFGGKRCVRERVCVFVRMSPPPRKIRAVSGGLKRCRWLSH